jgi:hypothetical protein
MRIQDYINKRNGEPSPSSRQQPRPESAPSSNNISPEEMIDKYSRMSEEQLMQEMFRSASASRASGQLTDEMLDSFYNQAKCYLSPEQSERMSELIRELKK